MARGRHKQLVIISRIVLDGPCDTILLAQESTPDAK